MAFRDAVSFLRFEHREPQVCAEMIAAFIATTPSGIIRFIRDCATGEFILCDGRSYAEAVTLAPDQLDELLYARAHQLDDAENDRGRKRQPAR